MRRFDPGPRLIEVKKEKGRRKKWKGEGGLAMILARAVSEVCLAMKFPLLYSTNVRYVLFN
jgi:hypothetical protein